MVSEAINYKRREENQEMFKLGIKTKKQYRKFKKKERRKLKQTGEEVQND